MSESVSHPAVLPITPSDVIGCRYRTVLNRAVAAGQISPDGPGDFSNQVERLTHRLTVLRRQAQVLAMLPAQPRQGDRVRTLSRVDVVNDDFDAEVSVEKTLEAMAEGARLITNAHLADGPLDVRVDLLVREDFRAGIHEDMTYIPICFSGHSVAKEVKTEEQANCKVLDVSALGLSEPIDVLWRRKTNPGDTQTLAIAHTVLSSWGFASDLIGLVATTGKNAYRCFFSAADLTMQGLSAALDQPIPTQPRRIKECELCTFHDHCRVQLQERLDISLLLSGGKSTPFVQQGITTIPQLAVAKQGEPSLQAKAWLDGQVAVRRPLSKWVKNLGLWGGQRFSYDMLTPEFDGVLDWVEEIDVDMEAHPERGTFLWGTFDGQDYRSFGDWSASGDKGRHVAEFWDWMKQRKEQALKSGKHFQVWVYSAQGEHYWLRHYAERYGGRTYGDVVMPTRKEVDDMLWSGHWCDVFVSVKKALIGTGSLGLKTIAPLAGFNFSQEGVDGRTAITLYEQAMRSSPEEATIARRTLEKYNADDCYATRAVRQWLRRGAPGIPETRHYSPDWVRSSQNPERKKRNG